VSDSITETGAGTPDSPAEPRDTGLCWACKYWRLLTSVTRNGREVFLGLCRYDPPHNSGWPLTFEDDLCHRQEKADG